MAINRIIFIRPGSIGSDKALEETLLSAGGGKVLVLDPAAGNMQAAEEFCCRYGLALCELPKQSSSDLCSGFVRSVAEIPGVLGTCGAHWCIQLMARIGSDQRRLLRLAWFTSVVSESKSTGAGGTIFVLTDDPVVVDAVRLHSAAQGDKWSVSVIGHPGWTRQRVIRAMSLGKSFFGKSLISFWNFFFGVANQSKPESPDILFRTIFKSPPEAFNRYDDYYFATLHQALAPHSVVFWGAPYGWSLRQRLLQVARPMQGFVTDDQLLTPGGVARALRTALWLFFRIRGARQKFSNLPDICGIPSGAILLAMLHEEMWSPIIFNNALHYQIARTSARRFRCRSLMLAFENRPMDRQAVLGFRRNAPGVKMLGYHHAPIDESQTALTIAPSELNRVPIPDLIYTLGEYGRGELIERGFPVDRVKVLGALKQVAFLDAPVVRSPDGHGPRLNILVLLSSESIHTHYLMRALAQNFTGTSPCKALSWRFRFHPAYRQPSHFSNAERVSFPWDLSEGRSLAEDLDWADAVVNNGTSAALEALWKGRPVFFPLVKTGISDNALHAAPAMAYVISDFADFEKHVRKAITKDCENPVNQQRVAGYLRSIYHRGTVRDFADKILRDLEFSDQRTQESSVLSQ
jgi:hypothetical protein